MVLRMRIRRSCVSAAEAAGVIAAGEAETEESEEETETGAGEGEASEERVEDVERSTGTAAGVGTAAGGSATGKAEWVRRGEGEAGALESAGEATGEEGTSFLVPDFLRVRLRELAFESAGAKMGVDGAEGVADVGVCAATVEELKTADTWCVSGESGEGMLELLAEGDRGTTVDDARDNGGAGDSSRIALEEELEAIECEGVEEDEGADADEAAAVLDITEALGTTGGAGALHLR